jgi:hypothetical protein
MFHVNSYKAGCRNILGTNRSINTGVSGNVEKHNGSKNKGTVTVNSSQETSGSD